MSIRIYRIAVVVGLVVGMAAPAAANWFTDFCHEYCMDIKRRNCWPRPFNYADRQAANAPFGVMVVKGWQQQNLLDDFYFAPGTGELTEAGQNKVRLIATQVPPPHRAVYVHSTDDAEETAARINAVEHFLARVAGDGQMPTVTPTQTTERGWPAERVDFITRNFQSSAPPPRLPKPTMANGPQK